MDENDRELLTKYTSRFTSDLDVKEVLPILIESGLWRDVHQAELDVCVL
jgi:hypothetical protein